MRNRFLCAGLFLVVAGGVAVPWLLGPIAEDPGPRLALVVLAGVAWAVALATAERWGKSRAALVACLCGAMALRLVALLGAPGTSDDVHRYVWEGALVLEGESPYAEAPSAPARAAERERWPELFARINHPEVAAAYPPLTQAVCAFGVFAAGGLEGLDESAGWRDAVWSLRLLFTVADLMVLLPLALLLKRSGRPPALLIAWGWCPLVVLESGGAAHFDAVGVLLLMAALASSAQGRWRWSSLWLAGGALVKWLPLAALPFAARDARRFVMPVAIVVACIAAGHAPLWGFNGGLQGVFGGLGEYAFRWESFSLLFRWIEGPLREYLPLDEGWNDARRVARAVVLACLALAALALWLRRVDAPRATGMLLALFVVLTPTLHPWYLLWVVPFLALRRSPAFLWLIAVAPLAYWPLARWQHEGVWVEPGWLWPGLALPFLALLVVEVLQHVRAAPHVAADPS